MSARAVVAWLFSLPILAQFGGTGGGSGAPRVGNVRTPPPATFLSGRVFLDDGGVISNPVSILGGCRGPMQLLGYTDLKGNFSFDLKNTAVSQDAESTKSRASAVCEIQAKLDGYRSGVIDLSARDAIDSRDVGTILLHRVGEQEGTTVSMTSLLAPKDAKHAFDKGMALGAKGHLEEAAQQFEKAAGLYPKYADAWYRLGDLQMRLKNEAAGQESLKKAIAADPKLVPPYVELAGISARASRWPEVIEYTEHAIRLDPFGFPALFYFNALANYNLENWQASERSARQVKKLDPQHRFLKINRILAAALANRGDYAGAAEQLREYLKLAGESKDADEVRGQIADLERRVATAGR
jgi:tetratricopeptide (TPR) repeat protein